MLDIVFPDKYLDGSVRKKIYNFNSPSNVLEVLF